MIFFIKHYQLLFIILFSALLIAPVSAEIFKCKTPDGKTTYSSKKCAGSSTVFLVKEHNTAEQAAETKNTLASVDIYITNWCPYCKKAMAYLRSKNIPFNIYDIENDRQAKSRKQKLAPGYRGVPLTVINGEILKGFSASRFDKALNL